MTEKKEPRKKSDSEKQKEKDAMVNLWMNNLGTESATEETSDAPQDEKKD